MTIDDELEALRPKAWVPYGNHIWFRRDDYEALEGFARGQAERLAAVEEENARLREMLAEVLGHMEPLAHHAILGPVGSPREWVSEGREMARQAMLNVGRWGVAALASVPGATGETAEGGS